MKILSLTADNFMRINAVHIDAAGNVVEISGKNDQGKSSVLAALMAALGGTRLAPDTPVRMGTGKEDATIVVRLGGDDDGRELIVTRRFKTKGNNPPLEIKSKDGLKYSKPQDMLNDLIGALTFDPLAFVSMKPDDQARQLQQLAGIDLATFDARRLSIFDRRTEENRTVTRLTAEHAAIVVPDDTPAKPISMDDLLAEQQRARESAAGKLAHDELLKVGRVAEQRAADEMATTVARMEELRLRLITETAEHKRIADKLAVLEAEPVPAVIDEEPIRERIRTASATNANVERKTRKETTFKALQAAMEKAELLTGELDGLDKDRDDVIAACNMPIAGLGFSAEGVVTFNGLPLAQASGAQRLRVSVAIAAALNPTLRIARIEDGARLDQDSMAMLAAWCDENEFQLWVETVDSKRPAAIIIEDGRVASPEAVAAE